MCRFNRVYENYIDTSVSLFSQPSQYSLSIVGAGVESARKTEGARILVAGLPGGKGSFAALSFELLDACEGMQVT